MWLEKTSLYVYVAQLFWALLIKTMFSHYYLNLKVTVINISPPPVYAQKVSFRSPGSWSGVTVYYDPGFSKQHNVTLRHLYPFICRQNLDWTRRVAITSWYRATLGNKDRQRHIEARSHNFTSRGKATSSKHYKCVSVFFSLLYNGCRVFPGGKAAGAWR